MSDKQWLTADAMALIRATLEPLLDRRRDEARQQGSVSEPEDVERKAHFVGQAQGVSDALAALEDAFGVPSRRGPERPAPANKVPGLVVATAAVSPQVKVGNERATGRHVRSGT